MSEHHWPYPPQWQERREEVARCGCHHCAALRADPAARAESLARYLAGNNAPAAPAAPAGAAR